MKRSRLLNKLSNARVKSISKKEYVFAAHYLQRFINSSKSISDQYLNA